MSLRIIHTADWHLGQTFYEYDRTSEHERFLEWLKKTILIREADVLVISGDIFDVSNPSSSSQRIFYNFLKEVTTLRPGLQVICIAGNHDSAARLESPRSLLEVFRVYVSGVVSRDEKGEPDFEKMIIPLQGKTGKTEAWCLAVPFLRPGDFLPGSENSSYSEEIISFYRKATAFVQTFCEPDQGLLVTGHLHTLGSTTTDGDKSERPILGGLEFVPADAFGTAPAYVALGHIHRPQAVGGNETVRYAGSPLPMSFSEEHYDHQVVCIDLEKGKTTRIEPLPVPVTLPLLSLPARPQNLSRVLNELEMLPDAGESIFNTPYLRVRVLLEGPEPSLRFQVEKAIENKNVRLAKIEVSYPPGDPSLRETEALSESMTPEILQPIEIFRRKYFSRFGCEIPGELIDLFHEAATDLNMEEETLTE